VEVAVREAIEGSPAAAATMAPICRDAVHTTATEQLPQFISDLRAVLAGPADEEHESEP
jgi:hypothetical protein